MNYPSLQHIIITRFCYSAFENFHKGKNSVLRNPLEPNYLELRTRLFEIFCGPSISSQTNEHFQWVIIIDKMLPDENKMRLRNSIDSKVNVHFHIYDHSESTTGIEWLSKYVDDGCEYLLTTNHDDDDCLPNNFVETVQSKSTHFIEKSSLNLKMMGIGEIAQWDMIFSNSAPHGHFSQHWHRWSIPFSSCGFTLLAQYPQLPFNVLEIKHRSPEKYINHSVDTNDPFMKDFHKKLIGLEKQEILIIDKANTADYVVDLTSDTGPVLMANHTVNDQLTRLYEAKRKRRKVSAPDFPSFSIDWKAVEKYSNSFKKDNKALIAGQTMRFKQKVRDALRLLGIGK